MTPKIVSCCYCGMRAALVFDQSRHALACMTCGAPLREMKTMPQHAETQAKNRRATAIKGSMPRHKTCRMRQGKAQDYPEHPRRKRRKSRKSFVRRMLEEMEDLVEDIFD